ncbi:MAG TPA: FAD-dependent monooxygenase [Acetobacteraceae bacterium]|jgi:menaquinone-9 beta-reductase|nr:FAD-dependent monooxygenase [Acetobacteraceae bacterium]
MRPPVIIGGGPAGAAAAATIAAAGTPVTLIERNTGPTDKVCGDFLSGGAIAALRGLGVDPFALGAESLSTVRLVHRGTIAEARLPFLAAGLSRRSLDEALLDIATRRGAMIRRGETVRGMERSGTGFTVRTGGGETLAAETVFLATGKHDLRGLPRPPRANGLLGLKMYFFLVSDQRAALRSCIELMLLNGGYAGLQLVEQDRAVLCMLLPGVRYRNMGRNWNTVLDELCAETPLLQHRLAGAAPCLARPLAISGTPYGHLFRAQTRAAPDVFRLGDQACVVPSFAGDGIAIALHSGMMAATAWLNGLHAPRYHAEFARQVRAPLRFASLIHFVARTPTVQPMMAAAARCWPMTLRQVASLTRMAPVAYPPVPR